jgi:hypothetical protein
MHFAVTHTCQPSHFVRESPAQTMWNSGNLPLAVTGSWEPLVYTAAWTWKLLAKVFKWSPIVCLLLLTVMKNPEKYDCGLKYPNAGDSILYCTAAAILVGEHDCRTQFWKRPIQWLFHQSLVLIELLVPNKMVFMWISHRVLCWTKYSCAAILVRGRDHQTQFWKRTIQWLFHQSLDGPRSRT